MRRLVVILILVAVPLATGTGSARSNPLKPRLTKIFRGSRFLGSITRVREHGVPVSWRMNLRVDCGIDPYLYIEEGTIYWESEHNIYASARRRSATRWDIFGDPEGPGPRLIGWAVQQRPGRWEIHQRVGFTKRFRWRGYASGPDGGAAGVALLMCT